MIDSNLSLSDYRILSEICRQWLLIKRPMSSLFNTVTDEVIGKERRDK